MEAQHVIYVYLKITHYARLCNKIHKIMEEIKLGINIQTPIQWHIGKKKKIRDDTKSESVGHSVKSDSFQTHGLQPSRLLSPWNSPGKNTGIGCHLLLQETFPTQESDPRLSLLHCRQIRYH